MTTKKFGLILPLILLMMVGFASASVNWTISFPNGTTVNHDDWIINVTINSSFELDGRLNCTMVNLSMISANTANNTVDYSAAINDSVRGGPGDQNGTWRIPVNAGDFEDGLSYTADFSCWNQSTNSVTHTTDATVITVDHGVPVAATSTYPLDGVTYKTNNTVFFQGTFNDGNTTSVTIVWRDISPTGRSVDATNCTEGNTGTICSVTSSGTPDGDYYWAFSASDGTNTTNMDWDHVLIDFQGMTGAAKAIIITGGGDTGSSGVPPIVKIILVGVVIYAVVQFSGGKKGKKKKG